MISGTTIVAPVTTTDVKTILRGSSNNVTDLCLNSNINMWSRFKPVHIRGGVIDRNSMWWKGTSGDCGINLELARCLSYLDVKDKMTIDKKNGWGYIRPSGGMWSPYRLADFTKYNHIATPPVAGMGYSEKVGVNSTLNILFMSTPTTTDKTSPGSVTFDDIIPASENTSLNNFYIGVALYNGDTFLGRVTATTSGIGSQVSFTLNDSFRIGNFYQIYPFFSRNQLTQDSIDGNNIYYTIPNISPGKFKVATAEEIDGITITASGFIPSGFDSGTYSVKVAIERGGKTFIGNQVYIRYSSSKPTDPILDGESLDPIPTFTIDPDNPYYNFGSFSVRSNKSYYIYVTLDKGRYTMQSAIMQELPPQQ